MNQVAMDEGALACLDGKLSSENPYRQGSDERFGWLLGWISTKPRPANFAGKWAGSLGDVVVPDALETGVAIEVDGTEPILMPDLKASARSAGCPVWIVDATVRIDPPRVFGDSTVRRSANSEEPAE